MRDDLRDEKREGSRLPVAGLVEFTATDTDVIEMDPADFDKAIGLLERRRAELEEYRAKSAELAHDLPDGTGPVARQMRAAFKLRAQDIEGGVQRALNSYIAQLNAVIEELTKVRNTHVTNDAQIADALKRQL